MLIEVRGSQKNSWKDRLVVFSLHNCIMVKLPSGKLFQKLITVVPKAVLCIFFVRLFCRNPNLVFRATVQGAQDFGIEGLGGWSARYGPDGDKV